MKNSLALYLEVASNIVVAKVANSSHVFDVRNFYEIVQVYIVLRDQLF